MNKKYQRRIQIIGGTTYSVSLPKEWALKYDIKTSDEVRIYERADGVLELNARKNYVERNLNSVFEFYIEEYDEEVGQMIYVLYYLGFREVIIKSKEKITTKKRRLFKDILEKLAGAEIIDESETVIHYKVLIDISDINIHQLFYRISLIIMSTIESILENKDFGGIERNSREISRLYNLVFQMIIMAQKDSQVLLSSGITNYHYILSYQNIARKLSLLSDNIFELCSLLGEELKCDVGFHNFMNSIGDNLKEDMIYFMNKESKKYTRFDREFFDKLKEYEITVKYAPVKRIMIDMINCSKDIEISLTNISIYSTLIQKEII